jgi:15-cis-phytoene desaturase
MSQFETIIIGGGIAGLTAACALAERGKKICLLESESRLGGRASSLADETTGDLIDIGPHILFSEYPNFLKLLKLLGSEQKIVWQKEEITRVFIDGERHDFKPQRFLPPPFHLLPLLWGDNIISPRSKLSHLGFLFQILDFDEEKALQLDKYDADVWLTLQGVDVQARERVWAFASMAVMNVPLQKCSAGSLLRFFHKLAGRNDYTIGFPDGGLINLFAAPGKNFVEQHGGKILLGQAVREIIFEHGTFAGVRTASGELIQAEACISTVPLHLLSRLLPPVLLEPASPFSSFKKFEPSSYKSVYLWFDRKLTTMPFWARWGRPDFFNLDFYDLSNIGANYAGRNSIIASNIIHFQRLGARSDEEILGKTLEEIADVLPAARGVKPLHYRIHDIPMAIHCPYPGLEALRPAIKTALSGFYLAGDFSRTALPASMESAARAGWLAAEEVLRSRGEETMLAVAASPAQGLFQLRDLLRRKE